MTDQSMLAYLVDVLRANPIDPKNKETLKRLLQIQAQEYPAPIPPDFKPSKRQTAAPLTISPPGVGIEMTTVPISCPCQC